MITDTSGMYALFEKQDDKSKRYECFIVKVIGWDYRDEGMTPLVTNLGSIVSTDEFKDNLDTEFCGLFSEVQFDHIIQTYKGKVTVLGLRSYIVEFTVNDFEY